MIREKLIEKGVGETRKFRWRSHEISRIVMTLHGMLNGKRRRKVELRVVPDAAALETD